MWEDLKPEDQEKIIEKAAEIIFKYDMDLVAILLLESVKPVATIGSQFTRYMIAPFIPFIGERSMPYLATFERKENVEKLIRLIEERSREDEMKLREEEKRVKATPKKGWRRFLPF
jgi:acyl-CoA reductase-like NAD-dependent aldehyde dehydrogenase